MKRFLVSLALLCAISFVFFRTAFADVFNMPDGQTSLVTVSVGNPGNTANQLNFGSIRGIGSVGYNYSIGEYDVTVGQYTEFLNAVAATDPYGLYVSNMATDLHVAGIQQNGASGSYTYSVIGSPNHPIAYISWSNAARFANWLYNGQPDGAEGANTTETGSYTLNTGVLFPTRNTNATWVIPTEDEWYKAAYYNPSTKTYNIYPFSIDTAPTTSAPPGNTPDTANFYDPTTGYAVTGSSTLSSTQNYLTDVGAYTASASPYGAFDMGGDVFQWNETLIDGARIRGLSGDSWSDTSLSPQLLLSYYGPEELYDYGPSSGDLYEVGATGFRVALVPEPSSVILLALASLGLLWRAKRWPT
ncbi:MAG TPA: SUMF1/EgtB/PvdO family nonheme iron enzyme [Pirellulales bacterium]|nr:SUMF1/EgtB/PvdO family nonheme iron enzyme [Pirellulales bacterium]